MMDFRQCTSILVIWPINEMTLGWVGDRGVKLIDTGDDYMALRIPFKCPNYDKKKKCCKLEDPPEWCQRYPHFFKPEEIERLGLDYNRLLEGV